MDNLAQHWSTNLAQSQRDAWNTYAANTPYMDGIGQPITMSGFNAFVKSNMLLQMLAVYTGVPNSPLDTAPTTFDTGPQVQTVDAFGGFAVANTIVLAASWSTVAPDDGDMFMFIAPPQNPGRKFFKGPYQFAATAPFSASDDLATVTADITDSTEWYSETTPIVGWDGLYIPIRLVNRLDDGRVSADYQMLVQFTDNTP